MVRKFQLNMMVVLLLFINTQIITATNQFIDVDENDWYYSYVDTIKEYVNGYPDGSFKPNNNISVMEFLALVVRTNNLEFDKIPSSPWYQKYINISLDAGLILPNEFLDYKRNISRGEMANILSRIPIFENTYRTSSNQVRFVDEIPEEYIESVQLMYEKGIVSGYEDHTFRANSSASRAEALVMLIRAIDDDYTAEENLIPLMVKLDENNKLQVMMTLQEGKEKIIEFDYVGVNKIYSISSIKTESTMVQVTSDFIGPYIMAKNDSTESNGQFTGGWHGTNGDGTGEMTGSTTNVSFLLDQKPIVENQWLVGDHLSILVENSINGNNTLRPILEEYVTYTISNQLIKINLKAVAIEDLTIYRYYGLQTQNKMWQEIVYGDETIKNSIYQNTNSNSARNYTLNSNDGYFLRTELDNSGLGTFINKKDQLPTCFSLSYGKSYFNLINGIKLEVGQSESFNWSGSYFFYYKQMEE